MRDEKTHKTHQAPPDVRRTYVFCERGTGVILGAHQIVTPAQAGARARHGPGADKRSRERLMARLAAGCGRPVHELAVLEAPGLATGDLTKWRVEVEKGRLVASPNRAKEFSGKLRAP